MLVGNIMTSEVITVTPSSSIGMAIELMREHGFRRLPVVEDGKLIGIVTDRDLRQATNSPLVLRERWYSEFLLDAIKVRSCMTANPITVEPATAVVDAARLLRQHKIGGLPVVDARGGDRVVGMVTITDLLDCLIHLLSNEGSIDPTTTRPD
jgi:acetoin utilization protein AcuB